MLCKEVTVIYKQGCGRNSQSLSVYDYPGTDHLLVDVRDDVLTVDYRIVNKTGFVTVKSVSYNWDNILEFTCDKAAELYPAAT